MSTRRKCSSTKLKSIVAKLTIGLIVLVVLYAGFRYEFRILLKSVTEKVPEQTSITRTDTGFSESEEVTVVTAYFNIGKFGKGAPHIIFSPSLYHHWMHVFARLESPVVAYFDNNDDLQFFRQIRNRLADNLTVTVLVNREKMWSFALEPGIAKIFSRRRYSTHYPNTVVPLYSAAMHAKYEVMNRTVVENPFKTMYFCWLDIGLFRDDAKDAEANPNGPRFSLYLPENFREDSIAYQEVWDRDPNATARKIIDADKTWVCGCFFIGEARVIYHWVAEYKEIVHRLVYVDQLMSTDQQVIYIAYNSANPPKTVIQTYRDGGHQWFGLANRSREAGLARMKMKQMKDNMQFENVQL